MVLQKHSIYGLQRGYSPCFATKLNQLCGKKKAPVHKYL